LYFRPCRNAITTILARAAIVQNLLQRDEFNTWEETGAPSMRRIQAIASR
jgi:hypothetical protein